MPGADAGAAGEEQIAPMEGLKAEGPALPQGSQLQQMLNTADELKLGFSSQDGRGACAGAHRCVWSPHLALSTSRAQLSLAPSHLPLLQFSSLREAMLLLQLKKPI